MSAPQGWAWRATSRFTADSRAKRFDHFMGLLHPQPDETILDVGIIDSTWRSSNPLEAQYPHLGQVTAVSLAEAPGFSENYPEVELVIADGRDLPFEDDQFDVGFSNAVVEHVGDRDQQRRFVHELVRTCRSVMIATPNAAFPLDPHTLLPCVHWLPRRVRHPILRATGNARWADVSHLNPLTARAFRTLFPGDAEVRIVHQRVLGLSTNLLAVVDRR